VLALGALAGHFKSGAMRGLVSSSRFPEFPDIPTMSELGYPQDLLGVWLAFFAPGGVGPEVTGTLVPAIERSVRNPEIGAKLVRLGILQEYAAPEAVRAEMRDEYRRVGELARKAGLVK
jgi:tripartite-type tricarboxylate transporter receptor subunit TctC